MYMFPITPVFFHTFFFGIEGTGWLVCPQFEFGWLHPCGIVEHVPLCMSPGCTVTGYVDVEVWGLISLVLSLSLFGPVRLVNFLQGSVCCMLHLDVSSCDTSSRRCSGPQSITSFVVAKLLILFFLLYFLAGLIYKKKFSPLSFWFPGM